MSLKRVGMRSEIGIAVNKGATQDDSVSCSTHKFSWTQFALDRFQFTRSDEANNDDQKEGVQ